MPVSISLLVVPVNIPNGRTEHTTKKFDGELKGELLLNCFIAFLKTFPVGASADRRG